MMVVSKESNGLWKSVLTVGTVCAVVAAWGVTWGSARTSLRQGLQLSETNRVSASLALDRAREAEKKVEVLQATLSALSARQERMEGAIGKVNDKMDKILDRLGGQ